MELLSFQNRQIRLDLDYDARVANIRGSEGSDLPDNRHNGEFFLQTDGPAATVIDDDERDVMTGSSGRDWFFADLDEDKNTDLHDDEFADVLDWILED